MGVGASAGDKSVMGNDTDIFRVRKAGPVENEPC